jgi:hypothetical protein
MMMDRDALMQKLMESVRNSYANRDPYEDLGSGEVDRTRARKAAHMATGEMAGTGIGTGIGMATGNPALAGVLGSLGGQAGKLGGAQWEDVIQDPWKNQGFAGKARTAAGLAFAIPTGGASLIFNNKSTTKKIKKVGNKVGHKISSGFKKAFG